LGRASGPHGLRVKWPTIIQSSICIARILLRAATTYGVTTLATVSASLAAVSPLDSSRAPPIRSIAGDRVRARVAAAITGDEHADTTGRRRGTLRVVPAGSPLRASFFRSPYPLAAAASSYLKLWNGAVYDGFMDAVETRSNRVHERPTTTRHSCQRPASPLRHHVRAVYSECKCRVLRVRTLADRVIATALVAPREPSSAAGRSSSKESDVDKCECATRLLVGS
jgi:hypothetical protein